MLESIKQSLVAASEEWGLWGWLVVGAGCDCCPLRLGCCWWWSVLLLLPFEVRGILTPTGFHRRVYCNGWHSTYGN